MRQLTTVDDWLVSIGEGWRPLVKPLIEYCNANSLHIYQIKEKFGGLRFYADIDDTLDKMIAMTERACAKTCEQCGKPGALRGGSWLRTLCDEHAGDRPILRFTRSEA